MVIGGVGRFGGGRQGLFILFYFIFCLGINTLTLLNKVGASGIKFQPAFCH
jgi:hypothetical protein